MKTRDAQGSFITVTWTLIAKVKELADAPIVLVPPRADMADGSLLQPMISCSMHRELVKEARLDPRVLRSSSVGNVTPPARAVR